MGAKAQRPVTHQDSLAVVLEVLGALAAAVQRSPWVVLLPAALLAVEPVVGVEMSADPPAR